MHAGLDLVGKIGDLSPSGGRLQARIAMATGVVLIGSNQTVIGEAVMTAARLRNMTPPIRSLSARVHANFSVACSLR